VGAGAFWPDASAGTAIFENVNTTVPAIPRSLSATPEAARISLAWQDRSVNEAGFRIERRATNGSFSEIASVGANISEYRDNAVQPGVTYEYRVRAFNASGQSSYSNRAAATIP
jgi:predicted phage tail protein